MQSTTQQINIGIIEDNPLALKSMQLMVERDFPNDQIVFTSSTVNGSIKALNKHHPNLVVMDVQLSDKQTAFDLLDALDHIDFQVIFVTGVAKKEFSRALINYPTINYLLKPLDPELFLQSIKRAKYRIAEQQMLAEIQKLSAANVNPLKDKYPKSKNIVTLQLTQGRMVTINLKHLIKCQSNGDLTYLFLDHPVHKKLVLVKNLKSCEKDFNPQLFFRTHKQYLVNLAYVDQIHTRPSLHLTLTNKETVPLARRRKEAFKKRMHQFKQEVVSATADTVNRRS